MAVADFRAVVRAVESGDAERGMLPLRNSRAGEVEEVSALLAPGSLDLIGENSLPVRMHLMGLPGAKVEQLTIVTSHPVALRQCAASLARLAVATHPAANTASAARDLTDPRVGVLASEAAARAYGLDLLLPDMQDDPNNSTTFAVVARRTI
jgi:prephenate dehydratase